MLKLTLKLWLILSILTSTLVGADADADADEEEKEKPKYPLLKKKIKDASKIDGFLTLYKKENQLFLALKSEDLENDFFYFSSVSRGTLGGMVFPHWILDEKVLYFQKVEKRILLFERDIYHTAKKDSPTQKAVQKAYLDSLLHSFPITAATEDESTYLVSLNPFFFQAKSHAIPSWMAGNIQGLSSGSAFWSRVKGFPGNIELEIQMSVGKGNGSSNQVRMYYSLVKKETNEYKPRRADDRIGYFTHEKQDFSKLVVDDGIQRYITRWYLEKSDGDSKHSVVKKPIIFYLDKTIPHQYRKHVRAGVLEWNKAFEKVGYVGAVEVRLPTANQDWDPSDVRYSTISWAADSAGMAIGPSRVNPETGEILDADIIVSSGWLTYMIREAELFGTGPLGGGDKPQDESKSSVFSGSKLKPDIRKKLSRHGIYPCEASLGLGSIREFTLMSARIMKNIHGKEFEEWKEKFVGTYIKNLVMHEVGHTLGLRHNFRASAAIPYEKLRDKNWTTQNQVNSSVMDYDDLNIAVNPEDQGKYMNDSLGPYDYLAIEYGYKPLEDEKEEKELGKIASSLREKGLEYGTDEDLYFGSDPLIGTYDIGDDPVEAATDRIRVVQRLLGSVEKEMVTTGDGFYNFRRILISLLNEYSSKSTKVAKIIGGIYSSRDHVKDPSGRLPYVPVSLEFQEKALKFLQEFVFQEGVIKISNSLLSKARTNPWDWGRNEPLSLENFHSRLRTSILQRLLNPSVMQRIADFHEKVGEKAFTLARLFEVVYTTVFGDLDGMVRGDERTLTEARIQLHVSYLEILGGYVVRGWELPGKANLYIRHSLDLLDAKLKSFGTSASTVKDFQTAANFVHYRSLREKIEQIRNAIIIQN